MHSGFSVYFTNILLNLNFFYLGSGQSDFASLNVTILDINDNTPQFNVEVPNIYDLEVPENQPSGTIVFKAQAIDPDEGPNGRVNIYISENL